MANAAKRHSCCKYGGLQQENILRRSNSERVMLLGLIQNHVYRCAERNAGHCRYVLPVMVVVVYTAATNVDLKSRHASNHVHSDIIPCNVGAWLIEDATQNRRQI